MAPWLLLHVRSRRWLAIVLFGVACYGNETWVRECKTACKDYGNFRDNLAEVKDVCANDPECPAIVDFSENGGMFAACKKGTGYRVWDKVCVERKPHSEL
eukprot:TRINITY_DN52769_c0_g1_i1.p1 TRINITY_DN52769_c0_g1~~TRINITY_DN52769_c0_g1_i1.p1  ORF type:complete len:117 (-),score=19.18 TRINITY_DN52769_c0_g1_i1:53-352(-)